MAYFSRRDSNDWDRDTVAGFGQPSNARIEAYDKQQEEAKAAEAAAKAAEAAAKEAAEAAAINEYGSEMSGAQGPGGGGLADFLRPRKSKGGGSKRRGTKRRGTKRRGTKRRGTKRRGTKRRVAKRR